MKAIIFANGHIGNLDLIRPLTKDADIIIAADGGYDIAIKLDLNPHYLVGDLDSIQTPIDKIKNTEIISYDRKKDYTDLELALIKAKELGAIKIFTATGGGIDQTICNVLMLAAYKNACIIDETGIIWVTTSKLTINGNIGDTISLIPIETCTGITTAGLEYPLNNETLFAATSRGISNVMTATTATIAIKSGKIIVVKRF